MGDGDHGHDDRAQRHDHAPRHDRPLRHSVLPRLAVHLHRRRSVRRVRLAPDGSCNQRNRRRVQHGADGRTPGRPVEHVRSDHNRAQRFPPGNPLLRGRHERRLGGPRHLLRLPGSNPGRAPSRPGGDHQQGHQRLEQSRRDVQSHGCRDLLGHAIHCRAAAGVRWSDDGDIRSVHAKRDRNGYGHGFRAGRRQHDQQQQGQAASRDPQPVLIQVPGNDGRRRRGLQWRDGRSRRKVHDRGRGEDLGRQSGVLRRERDGVQGRDLSGINAGLRRSERDAALRGRVRPDRHRGGVGLDRAAIAAGRRSRNLFRRRSSDEHGQRESEL